MNSVNKTLILIIAYSIIAVNAYANNSLKKDKKSLIKFIKNESDSWIQSSSQITDSGHGKELYSEEMISEGLLKKEGSVDQNDNLDFKDHHKFADFRFTIQNAQAIVKFTIDEQKFSAFFEKKNNEWKLICAAPLDPPA